jgi:hypothetical protein
MVGYYIRVLSPSDDVPAHSALEKDLRSEHSKAELSLEAGAGTKWDQLLLSHQDGSEIAVVERNFGDDLVTEEIEEFLEEIGDCQPRSSVEWLRQYLPTVRTIYAFQVLAGVELDGGWEVLGTLKSSVWRRASGIIQADGEGFTNEAGYHILWQFADSVTGEWWMGVFEDGHWIHFKMDLGDQEQRQAFFRGTVPPGAERA